MRRDLGHLFQPADYEKHHSKNQRWMARVYDAINRLRDKGIIEKPSPGRIWSLTAKGMACDPERLRGRIRSLRTPTGKVVGRREVVGPMLATLQQNGGATPIPVVRMAVHAVLQHRLTAEDYEAAHSEPDLPRWWRACLEACDTLIGRGLMSGSAPSGVWALTEAGMRWCPEGEGSHEGTSNTAQQPADAPTVDGQHDDSTDTAADGAPCRLSEDAAAVLAGRSGRKRVQRSRAGTTTSMVFEQPIVSALLRFGGKAASSQVRGAVYEEVWHHLLPRDRERYPSGPVRWTLHLSAAYQHLVQVGIIEPAVPLGTAPKGVWQLTDWSLGRSTTPPAHVHQAPTSSPASQKASGDPATKPSTGAHPVKVHEVRVSDEVLAALRQHAMRTVTTADRVLRHLLDLPDDSNDQVLASRVQQLQNPSKSGVTTEELKRLIRACLSAEGGTASTRHVKDTLRGWLDHQLNASDHEPVHQGLPRWEMRVAAVAQLLREEGVLTKTAVRGVWQLTDTVPPEPAPIPPEGDEHATISASHPLGRNETAFMYLLQQMGGTASPQHMYDAVFQHLSDVDDPQVSLGQERWQRRINNMGPRLVRRGLMHRSVPYGLSPRRMWMLTEEGQRYPTSSQQPGSPFTAPKEAPTPSEPANPAPLPDEMATATNGAREQPNRPQTTPWYWLRVSEEVLHRLQEHAAAPFDDTVDGVLRRLLRLPPGEHLQHPSGPSARPVKRRQTGGKTATAPQQQLVDTVAATVEVPR